MEYWRGSRCRLPATISWATVTTHINACSIPSHNAVGISVCCFPSQGDCFGTLPVMPTLVPRNDARLQGSYMSPAEGGRGSSLTANHVIASDGQAMRGCAKQSPRDTVRNDEAHGWIDGMEQTRYRLCIVSLRFSSSKYTQTRSSNSTCPHTALHSKG